MEIIVFALGMVVGLYSGKKRAKGEKWKDVLEDFLKDMRNCLAHAWNKLSYVFRRGE